MQKFSEKLGRRRHVNNPKPYIPAFCFVKTFAYLFRGKVRTLFGETFFQSPIVPTRTALTKILINCAVVELSRSQPKGATNTSELLLQNTSTYILGVQIEDSVISHHGSLEFGRF